MRSDYKKNVSKILISDSIVPKWILYKPSLVDEQLYGVPAPKFGLVSRIALPKIQEEGWVIIMPL